MAVILDSFLPPLHTLSSSIRQRISSTSPSPRWPVDSFPKCRASLNSESQSIKALTVPRRNAMALILSTCILPNSALAVPSVGLLEYIDTFDGYSFKYPKNWIQVRGAGADIFFRDPFVLDENLSVEFSSPSSSSYKSVEDLGPPEEAGRKVLKQYLTEFMSTRLGVRRESNVLSTSSRLADDGRTYYQVESGPLPNLESDSNFIFIGPNTRLGGLMWTFISKPISDEKSSPPIARRSPHVPMWDPQHTLEVNIKSYANNNELAVRPQDRVVRLEWNRRYLSVLGVENSRLYELRLQTPENVFVEEENDLRQVMDSFRVNKVNA